MSPTFATGVMSHILSRFIMLTVVPGEMYMPSCSSSASSGAAYAVEEASYKSGAELNRERLSGASDVLVDFQSVRVLVDLYRRVVAVHLYYLAHQLFRPDVDDLAHSEVAHSGGLDDRAVYKFDCAPMEGAAVIFRFQKPSLLG